MAGIGFELKKVFRERSVARTLAGAFYSTAVVLGPTLIIIALLLVLYLGLGFFGVAYSQRELLSSTILYIFIFSAIVTSPFNAVFSRYIADMIFEERYEDILSSYYVCLGLSIAVGALLGVPFSLRLVGAGVGPLYVLLAYCAYLAMVTILASTIYLHATKEYRYITFNFVLGALVGIALAMCLHYLLGVAVIMAIIAAMAAGLLLIAILQAACIHKYFPVYSGIHRACLQYIWHFRRLFLCNLFYTLGLYAHNFIFWHSAGNLVVAEVLYSHPAYDMATFLAVFTNLSLPVLFTVMVETQFHSRFQAFNEAVYGSTLDEIRVLKNSMFRVLNQQQTYITGVQAAITITVYILTTVLLPLIGFSSQIMSMYAILCVAYYAIMLMYNKIVILFYLNDNTGAMITALLFLLVTVPTTLYSRTLPIQMYGLGALVGALAGWSYSHFRLGYLARRFEEHIFCNMPVARRKRGPQPVHILYRREETMSRPTPPAGAAK